MIGSSTDSTMENKRFANTGKNGGEFHPGGTGGGNRHKRSLVTTAELIATD